MSQLKPEGYSNRRPFTFDRVVRILIATGSILLAFFIIQRLANVLLPFVIGFLIAYYLDPVVVFFQKKIKLKNRVLAVMVTLLCFLIIVALSLWLIIPQISFETQKLIELVSNYSQNVNLGTILPEKWQQEIKELIAKIDIKDLLNNDNFINTLKSFFPKLWSFIHGSINFLIGLFVVAVVFIYVVFILIDYEKLSKGMFNAVPPRYREIAANLIEDTKDAMNKYFRGQGLISLANGIVFAIGLSIIGLPMAIAMGILIGILTMIPYMQGLGLIPCALLGILKSAETGQSLWMILLSILIVFLVAQAIQDWIVAPNIMKKVTGLNPAIIILSLSVWGSLLGFIGMIIAIPLTTLIISYYKRYILEEEEDKPEMETPPATTAKEEQPAVVIPPENVEM